MAKLLHRFTYKDHGNEARDLSHAKLAEVISAGLYPHAECREDLANGEFYVYDDSERRETAAGANATNIVDNMTPEQIDKLADLIVKKLKGGA